MDIRANLAPWARILALAAAGLIGVAALVFVLNPAAVASPGSDLLDIAETTTGISYPVVVAVSLIPTITERFILFVVVGAVLVGLGLLARGIQASPLFRLAALAIVVSALLSLVFGAFPPLDVATGYTARSTMSSLVPSVVLGAVFAAALALAQTLSPRLATIAFGVIVAATAGFVSLIPSGIRLFETGSEYYGDEAVTDISPDSRFDFNGDARDINGLAIDTERRRLYADGHGVNHVYAYDIDEPEDDPEMSPQMTGGAESLAYNSTDQEIYVFDIYGPQLLILDAATLALKKAIADIELSPGDVLVGWDPRTRHIVLSSEADKATPVSLVVLDRDTGAFVYKDPLAASGLAVHPSKSWIYFSFYRDVNAVFAFDLSSNSYVARQETDLKRLDGIAVDENAKQVLIASPLRSEILRFDQDTLAPAGAIPAMFGVRTVALDRERGLLVCASLVTGYLSVIDAQSHKILASYRVAPWLRSVVLDTKTGRAFVSSNYGLFVVDYTRRLPAKDPTMTAASRTVP